MNSLERRLRNIMKMRRAIRLASLPPPVLYRIEDDRVVKYCYTRLSYHYRNDTEYVFATCTYTSTEGNSIIMPYGSHYLYLMHLPEAMDVIKQIEIDKLWKSISKSYKPVS